MAERIKIFHLLYSLGTGGLENGVVNLVNNMNPEEYEHCLCVLTPERTQESRVRNGVDIRWINCTDRGEIARITAVSREIARWRPDIVHTRAWGTMIYGVLAARRQRVAGVVHSFHGRDLNMVERIPWRRLVAQNLLLLLVDRIIMLSPMQVEEYRKKWEIIQKGKVRVICNGVDTCRFAEVRSRDALVGFIKDKDTFVVGCVARFDPVKGQQTLLEAFAMVREKVSNALLVLVGDGPLLAGMKEKAKDLGIMHHVVFAGNCPNVDDFYRSFDLYVQPSLYEGISNTILEAMASRLPVIATDSGGNPYLVEDGETGLLVSAGDPAALAEKILHCYGDKQMREKIAGQAREYVEQHLSLEVMVEKYEDMYRLLCGRSIS